MMIRTFRVNTARFARRAVMPATAAVAGLLALTACGGDRAADPATRALSRSITLCETTFKRGELIEMLDGTLIIAAGFRADGLAATDIVGGFVAGFLLNTLDFEALDRWGASFDNGRYRIRNGGNTTDLYLIADEAVAGYQPGDTLRENLFAPSTYVRNVSVNLSGVSYTRGPLFDLVSGGMSWSGTTPRLRLDATRLTLGVVSDGNWYVRWSETDVDTIRSRMMSVPLDLAALKADFKSGELGFSYDSTGHANAARKIRQIILQSDFRMTPLDEDGKRWSWEGTYRNHMSRVLPTSGDSLRFHMLGYVSTVGGNGSNFYCDEDLTGLIGVAVQDTSLTWGYFKSVAGDSIAYGLVPAGK